MPHFTDADTKALRGKELAQGHARDGAGITDADSPPPDGELNHSLGFWSPDLGILFYSPQPLTKKKLSASPAGSLLTCVPIPSI